MKLNQAIVYRYLVYLSLILFLSNCNAYLNQPMRTAPARIGEQTDLKKDLKSLPKTSEPIVVGVYKFRDQTGQYKPSETGASWSTAVTQGATSMLIEALEDSEWFIPIERENLGNLLNERKIIRSSKMQYTQGEESAEPLIRPLLFAGVILEGGIVSYDANMITGGAGLRYFGAGGSGQYRQDRVTVSLRAISTQSGKILKSIYTSKTLLSQSIDVGVFRYVSFKRLLEFETGITFNEPADMAVREAIEKAVYCLVMEGLIDGLWEADPKEKGLELAIRRYQREHAEMAKTDIFGSKLYSERRKAYALIALTGSLNNGDYPDAILKPGVELGLGFQFSPRFSLASYFGYATLENRELFKEETIYFNSNLQYTFLPDRRFSPVAYAGGGVMEKATKRLSSGSAKRNYFGDFGIGAQIMLDDYIELQLSAEQIYLFDDGFDEVKQGKYDDQIWRGRIGLRLHFGKKQY